MALTQKQKLFIDEYLIDLNATQAAIRAGYSPNNADKIGSELLGKTRVSDAIKTAMAERSKRTGVNADRVVQELAKIAFVNATEVIDLNGYGQRGCTSGGHGCHSVREGQDLWRGRAGTGNQDG